MAESLGLKQSEKKFVKKWSAIRSIGRTRYVLTRGFIFGVCVFSIWLGITLIEMNISEYKRALYNNEHLIKSGAIWFVIYQCWGLIMAWSDWRNKEEKYRYLS